MNRSTVGRAAILSLAIGSATVACTPQMQAGHLAAASDHAARRSARLAARDAAAARNALDRRDADGAVRFAERAVAESPNDADHRTLLGQCYLATGRFASAEASFAASLSLAPDQPLARFDLGLAQVAQGRADDGRRSLEAARGRVPDADLGLALALAGDPQGGQAMLSTLIRSGKSDARARQNLALAYALDNRWGEARGLAMQDTPPDRIEARMAQWAALARDGAGATRVAALLGVRPAAQDPGQPQALALATPAADAPVALALAAPAPAPTPVPAVAPIAAPLAVAQAEPAQAEVATPKLLAAADPVIVTTSTPAAAPAPVRTAVAMPSEARFVRAAVVAPARHVSPGTLLAPSEQGGFVVQLGAFSRTASLQAAWSRVSRLSPRVATFAPVQGSTLRSGATLVRLSIGGFPSRDKAAAVCGQIRARGGACFVRAATGDRPWQWAARDEAPQRG